MEAAFAVAGGPEESVDEQQAMVLANCSRPNRGHASAVADVPIIIGRSYRGIDVNGIKKKPRLEIRTRLPPNPPNNSGRFHPETRRLGGCPRLC